MNIATLYNQIPSTFTPVRIGDSIVEEYTKMYLLRILPKFDEITETLGLKWGSYHRGYMEAYTDLGLLFRISITTRIDFNTLNPIHAFHVEGVTRHIMIDIGQNYDEFVEQFPQMAIEFHIIEMYNSQKFGYPGKESYHRLEAKG